MRRPAMTMAEIRRIGLLAIAIAGFLSPAEGASPSASRSPALEALRLIPGNAELLGPEYSLSWNTLDSGLKLFFSREVKGKSGEDLVEKQNAEMGLMPVVAEEAATY